MSIALASWFRGDIALPLSAGTEKCSVLPNLLRSSHFNSRLVQRASAFTEGQLERARFERHSLECSFLRGGNAFSEYFTFIVVIDAENDGNAKRTDERCPFALHFSSGRRETRVTFCSRAK